MRGFRFRLIPNSERGAHICLASSQNSNVWRPNIHVWTHFEPIFSLRVHGWIQTTVSQLAGVRGCRRKRQLSFFTIGCWLFIYRCSEDLNKQFSQSRNRFLRQILNVRSLQIILNEKSLVIKWFSLKIGYKRNYDTEVTRKIFTPKEGKRRFGEIVLIFRAKHENEVEAQRSEKMPMKQKCQSFFYLTR